MINPGMMISERYEIIEKVGTGGMADVFKAKCHRLNRFVAIKILKQEYSTDAKFVAKFRAEAQSVAGLSHPNIVNVYDVGDDNGLYYIVMELVEGITLKKFIEKKGRLDVGESVGIAIQIAKGMQAAHDNHIIHRDIKPQNIIISKEGKVKVTDFGIAKAATSNTITSNAMGSVHYISPEQARGGYSDEKSDIYSLGVTMYEMFSGSVPFEGDSTVTVALAHIQDEARMLDEVDENIPHSVAMIVSKCMQKKPEMRYLSASKLIDDLKRALDEPDGAYIIIDNDFDPSPTKKMSKEDIKQLKGVVRPEVKKNKDDDVIDPKLEKIIKICSVIVAIIICFVIIFGIGYFKGWWGGSAGGNSTATTAPDASGTPQASAEEGTIIVPDIVGDSLEDAEKALTAKNLKWQLSAVESDEEANTVTKQEPESGALADEYAVVTIYYSLGSDGVTIPDVTDKTETDAKTAIEDLGLTVSSTKEEYNDKVAEGNVISTDPVVGSSVDKGSSVILIISKGPESDQVTVPNIVGKKESVALEKLSDAGLSGNSNNVTYVYSDTVAEGSVVSQSQTAGTKVDIGTVIDYTVSRGPKTTTSPATATPNVSYVGSVTISDNPFSSSDEDPAIIKLVLSQDGETKTVWSGTLGYNDFPKSFKSIKGSSENNGTITMYKDGVALSGSYNIEFSKVSG